VFLCFFFRSEKGLFWGRFLGLFLGPFFDPFLGPILDPFLTVKNKAKKGSKTAKNPNLGEKVAGFGTGILPP
jgi:hypothetical protein